ncbi:MAG: S8 family serine peptidase [Alphaproteobacteria bacterium]|jgi:hypothetical protein
MRYLLLAFSILLFSSNLIAGVLENNLIKAVEEGNLVEATKQVELGADINFQDANGDTALIKATKAGDEKLAKYLVEQGADTQITNNAGYSALDVAKANKFTQIAKIIKSVETGISTGSPAAAGAGAGSSSATTAGATAGATAATAGATGAGISTGVLVAGGIAVVGGGVALAAGGGGGGGSKGGSSAVTEYKTSNDPFGYHPFNSVYTFDSFSPGSETSSIYNMQANANYAWMRGYTGIKWNRDANGILLDSYGDGIVKIAVVEPGYGIKLNHKEFVGNAGEAKVCNNFGCTNDIDGVYSNHITGVASVAAGNRDLGEISGIAYNAEVSSYTIGGNTSVALAYNAANSYGNKVINNSWGDVDVFVVPGGSGYKVSGHPEINLDGVFYEYDLTPVDSKIYYWDDTIRAEVLNASNQPVYISTINPSYNFASESKDFFNGINYNNAIVNAINNNVIFVWAAGNNGLDQSGREGALPYYFNGTPSVANGGSTVDLRGYWVNVVASKDLISSDFTRTDLLTPWSDRCGVTANWCLTAPGDNIKMADIGGGYYVGGGTSFSAPSVTGAIAVLQGAFPHLPAPKILKVLFETATDLGTPGVDTTYGWGLVNLDKATSPSAGGWTLATGAKTFSLASTSFDISRLSLGSSFGDALKNSNLKLQFFDSYYKNYTIDLNSLVNSTKNLNYEPEKLIQNYGENRFENNQALFNGVENSLSFSYSVGTKDTVRNQMKSEFDREAKFDKFALSHSLKLAEDRSISSTLSVNENAANVISTKALEQVNNENSFISAQTFKNPYLNLAEESKTVAQTLTNGKFGFGFGAFDGSLAKETSSRFTENNGIRGFAGDASYKVGEDSTVSLQSGLTEEQASFLGSSSGGAFSTGDKTKTFFGAVASKIGITDKFSLVGNYNLGWTDLNIAENSFFKNFSVAKSNSFAVGGNYKGLVNDKDSFGLTFSQPLRVYNAKVDLSLPVGIKQDGDVVYSNSRTSLTPQGQERNFEGSYSYKLNDKESLSFGSLLRLEPDNIKDAKSEVILMGRYRVEF